MWRNYPDTSMKWLSSKLLKWGPWTQGIFRHNLKIFLRILLLLFAYLFYHLKYCIFTNFFDSYNTACHEIALSFFIEVQLIYSTLPVYAIQQNDSVWHIYPFFSKLFFSIMVYSSQLHIVSLCPTVGPCCCLSILNWIVCIYQPQIPSPSLFLPFSPLGTTSLIALSMCLFLFCR